MASLAELIFLVDGDVMFSSAEMDLIIFNDFVCFDKVVITCRTEMRCLRWRRWIWSLKCLDLSRLVRMFSLFGDIGILCLARLNSLFGGDGHKIDLYLYQLSILVCWRYLVGLVSNWYTPYILYRIHKANWFFGGLPVGPTRSPNSSHNPEIYRP